MYEPSDRDGMFGPIDGWATRINDYAPGGEIWPKGYDQRLEISPKYDLGGHLGPGAKRVVINDHLPAGVLYMTDHEIILSKHGWDALLVAIDRQQRVRDDVRVIVEEGLDRELAWLRAAGHDV